MRLGVRAAPVFNKSFLKAEDAGVGNTEVRPWLACCSTWLSNASSNSDKGVDIWPPETAAIYSEKYIVKMSWGEKSSVLATPPPVSSSPLALPMPFCFFVLYAIDTGIRHQMVVLICSKPLSFTHAWAPAISKGPALPRPIRGSRSSASLTANPLHQDERAFFPM